MKIKEDITVQDIKIVIAAIGPGDYGPARAVRDNPSRRLLATGGAKWYAVTGPLDHPLSGDPLRVNVTPVATLILPRDDVSTYAI